MLIGFLAAFHSQAMLTKQIPSVRVAARRASIGKCASRRTLNILAAMQRAEYIWFDGSEGSPDKVFFLGGWVGGWGM